MKNNFAELLSASGYTDEQIDRYIKLVNRKQRSGLSALTISDRRYLLKARADVDQAEAKIDKALQEARRIRVSGAQPVENKLHYRWTYSELQIARSLVEVKPGEISAYVIFKEEVLRALSKYQPVLDTIDCSKRSKFNPLEVEFLDLASKLGRVANFDKNEFGSLLAAEFQEHWNNKWTEGLGSSSTFYGAVIPDTEEFEFRQLVRDEVEKLTREVYRTVAV